jgi:hypothetical protein
MTTTLERKMRERNKSCCDGLAQAKLSLEELQQFTEDLQILAHPIRMQIVVFENSGHFPWLEEPDVFFATVTSFLKGSGHAAGRAPDARHDLAARLLTDGGIAERPARCARKRRSVVDRQNPGASSAAPY